MAWFYCICYIFFELIDGQQIPDLRNHRKRRHVQQIKNTTNHTVTHTLPRQLISLYGSNGELKPQDLARCMIDTYRAMNKHYIPTGYELSAFAKYNLFNLEFLTEVIKEWLLKMMWETLLVDFSLQATKDLPPWNEWFAIILYIIQLETWFLLWYAINRFFDSIKNNNWVAWCYIGQSLFPRLVLSVRCITHLYNLNTIKDTSSSTGNYLLIFEMKLLRTLNSLKGKV